MAGAIVPEKTRWSRSRDTEGHRTYKITHLVQVGLSDGPQVVSLVPGLPQIGIYWSYGTDSDPWAFCTPEQKIERHGSNPNEPGYYWTVESTFTTRPTRRCQDTSIENPLLEPPKISGSFVKYTEEVYKDRHGNVIESSSHETIKGPDVEIDRNRPNVRIELNVSDLGLETFSNLVDKVSDGPMWGLAKRKVKLSNVSWERKYYGTCNIYYTRTMEFDINFETFDNLIADVGTMAKGGRAPNGEWDPGMHDGKFTRYVDINRNIARVKLNGNGEPVEPGQTVFINNNQRVEIYEEGNLFLLGIPATL